jgi:hypothetical protein
MIFKEAMPFLKNLLIFVFGTTAIYIAARADKELQSMTVLKKRLTVLTFFRYGNNKSNQEGKYGQDKLPPSSYRENKKG